MACPEATPISLSTPSIIAGLRSGKNRKKRPRRLPPNSFVGIANHSLDFSAAERHLAKCDPVMRRLIRAAGPCGLKPRERRPPFESLARAIAYQQLNGTAAETIV